MKAMIVNEQGAPDVLRLSEIATPEPGPGEIRVDVSAAGVNFLDVQQRSGNYRMRTPFVAGNEGAGVVSAIGDGVTEVHVGDRVGWAMIAESGYAEQVVIDADRAIPLPDAIDDETAAAVLLQGLTAHYLTRSTYPVQPGDTVLVHAAAGGTGLLVTQMVRLAGGRVIGTASTREKAEIAREAGAFEVLTSGTDDLVAKVRDLTAGHGVAAVYDGVGKDTFEASLKSLGRRGTLALYGSASGPVPPFDLQRLARGSLSVARPGLVDHIATRAELLWRAAEVFDWLEQGSLAVRVGGRYALADAARAHEDLAGRRTTGKLVIAVRGPATSQLDR
ncbi:zinc-binding dehydrogenase [Aeromicrobium sp. SMF47]|uniref:quinone oxidoreductase family protein n=1 Tax=Aeromicrobium yanjiei TaxID=2662028 RepID=UPI00129DE21F|nr:quinone oxidoreductase [Aeromicrobium yanjiei]MRJ77332.1 zinc-binding dehydrogenase [Aeromicrobium yanjiei]